MRKAGRARFWSVPLALCLLPFSLLTGCQRLSGEKTVVEVLYAGSLAAVMERSLGPAFASRTGWTFRGEAQGSRAAARFVADGLRHPDVYVTADAATLDLLGSGWPGWAIVFASGELALAYDTAGRFTPALDSAGRGELAWYDVLLRAGFRFGRTDPELDPKGYRTLRMFDLAGRHYGDPTLARRLAQASNARGFVFPEAHLAARLQTGQLDAGAFYLAEARGYGLRTIRLPPQIHLGEPQLADLYGTLRYQTARGEELGGSPIVYGATMPTGARNPEGALAFLQFLVGDEGAEILDRAGFPVVRAFLGDSARLPAVFEAAASSAAAEAGPER